MGGGKLKICIGESLPRSVEAAAAPERNKKEGRAWGPMKDPGSGYDYPKASM